MKRITYVAGFVCAFLSLPVLAQDKANTDSLVSDFNCFVRLLQSTHPDPYTPYGGKVVFYQKAKDSASRLKADSAHSVDELESSIRHFLLPLHDGHTYLSSSSSLGSAGNRWTPILAKVIGDGLIVKRLPIVYEALIGSRLLSINEVSIEKLYDMFSAYDTYENTIGQYLNVERHLDSEYYLKRVFPGFSGDSVRYHLCSPEGERITITLPFLTSDEYMSAKWASLPSVLALPKKNLAYAFLDNDKSVMYFKCSRVLSRDNFEYVRSQGMDYYRQLKRYYTSVLRTEMPVDTLEAISSLPSFSAEFSDMLMAMRQEKARTLIIDLRGNDGGWTSITYPTLYQLWGDVYLLKNMQTRFYTLVSPLLMEKNNQTLEQFNKANGMRFEFGDYSIEQEDDTPSFMTEEYRNRFVENSICSIKDELRRQKGNPIYTPQKVYVLTDADTFSAAFHYAFYLWKMGAVVVGVPSSQAPNTYMDQTPFVLPYTK